MSKLSLKGCKIQSTIKIKKKDKNKKKSIQLSKCLFDMKHHTKSISAKLIE